MICYAVLPLHPRKATKTNQNNEWPGGRNWGVGRGAIAIIAIIVIIAIAVIIAINSY